MSSYSDSDLRSIFELLDSSGRGLITRECLLSAARSVPGADAITAVLDVPRGQSWGFDRFRDAVQSAMRSSSPVKCPRQEVALALPAPAEPLLPAVQRLRAQVDEIRDLQADTR